MLLIASPRYSTKENLSRLRNLFPELKEKDYVIFPGSPYLNEDYIENNLPFNVVVIDGHFYKPKNYYDEHPSGNYKLIRRNIIELKQNHIYKIDDKILYVFDAYLPKKDEPEDYKRVSKTLDDYEGKIDFIISNSMVMKMFMPYLNICGHRVVKGSLEDRLFECGFKKWYCYNSGYSMNQKSLFAITNEVFKLE